MRFLACQALLGILWKLKFGLYLKFESFAHTHPLPPQPCITMIHSQSTSPFLQNSLGGNNKSDDEDIENPAIVFNDGMYCPHVVLYFLESGIFYFCTFTCKSFFFLFLVIFLQIPPITSIQIQKNNFFIWWLIRVAPDIA